MCIFEAEIGETENDIILKSRCYTEERCLKTVDLLNKLKESGIEITVKTVCPNYHDVKPFLVE